PSGCSMQLDRVATERAIESIKNAVPSRWNDKVNELRSLAGDRPHITLGEFLSESGLELDDVYGGRRSWSDLREAAGLQCAASDDDEKYIRRALSRLLHVDDLERLARWREWLEQADPPAMAS